VYTHNNIFRLRPTFSTNQFNEEIQALLDLFLKHEVNVVVTAHDHERNTDVLGSTTHIIMDALQDIQDKPSYLKLDFTQDEVDYSFVDL
jgi:hypothetical protein